jgi:hypothetical protein
MYYAKYRVMGQGDDLSPGARALFQTALMPIGVCGRQKKISSVKALTSGPCSSRQGLDNSKLLTNKPY